MSLHHLAENLKKQGRGKDSELVHMTKGEVAGLHALARAHGGSLTTNPTTGLTEAGFLDTILSVGGGFLGGMFGGPLGAAIGSGLGTYLGGGGTQKALMSGLMGYGLSGLGGAFESEGVNALNQQAMESLTTPEAAAQNLAANQGPYDLGVDDSAFSQTPEQFGQQVSDITTKNNALPWYQKMGAGLGEAAKHPIDFLSANKYPAIAAGLGAAGMMSPQQTTLGPQTHTEYAPTYGFNAPKQVIDPVTGQVRLVPASYTQGTPFPYTAYGAGGGTVPTGFKKPNKPLGVNEPNEPNQPVKGFSAGASVSSGPYGSAGPIFGVNSSKVGPYGSTAGPYQDTDMYSKVAAQMKNMSPSMLSKYAQGAKDAIVMAAAQDELDRRQSAVQNYMDIPTTQMAQGGIASFGEYAAGGKLLEGPGDGMSDSIPAVIKGPKPQRAALAQGEFVISADVVSGLGNGSTDAGAKRLYAMMDRVRKARTGTKKQGKQIDAERFLPA